ncbi:MAG: polysaccharide biosynthesis/export family protein [Pseudomonadota bacterium]
MKSLIHRIFGIMLCLCAFGAVAQESYTLSAGDEVSIVVFGEDDLTMDIKLNENGQINFPLLGAINASGMSVAELEATITRELSGAYLVNPDVRVSVAEYRQVFINGEVNAPGGYDYKPGLTLDKAVALAGGFSEKASKERVTLTREINGVAQQFSMRPTDAVLPGDIISIAEYLQVFVNGEVQRPGNYAYQSGLTVEKTIALAGGFSGRASKKRITVSRDIDGQQQQGRIRMGDPVYPGDIISVPEGFF